MIPKWFARENWMCVVFSMVFLTFRVCENKELSRCEFVRELISNKFERTFLTNWVCLAEVESNLTTDKVGYTFGGHTSFGIFQISSQYCATGQKPDGLCQMLCKHLIDEDLRDDSDCAKKIFDTDGFKIWLGWGMKCKGKGKLLPDITNCPEYVESYIEDPMIEKKISYNQSSRTSINYLEKITWLLVLFNLIR